VRRRSAILPSWTSAAAWARTLKDRRATPAADSKAKMKRETRSSTSVKPCSAERREEVKPSSS
jgi:hypothetical protein